MFDRGDYVSHRGLCSFSKGIVFRGGDYVSQGGLCFTEGIIFTEGIMFRRGDYVSSRGLCFSVIITADMFSCFS